MSIVDDVNKVISEFPANAEHPAELARLSRFFVEMKRAGIAKTQEYNLPRPNTLGRVVVKGFHTSVSGSIEGPQ
ncbi:MAG: hypothetical protein V2B18_10545 [Pseudomonadota bacterium]